MKSLCLNVGCCKKFESLCRREFITFLQMIKGCISPSSAWTWPHALLILCSTGYCSQNHSLIPCCDLRLICFELFCSFPFPMVFPLLSLSYFQSRLCMTLFNFILQITTPQVICSGQINLKLSHCCGCACIPLLSLSD